MLSSAGEVRFLRVYLYFALAAKRTGVLVLLYEALPKRRTAAKLAGFGVDCLLSPGGFPQTSSEDDTSAVRPTVEQTGNGNPWSRLGGITITAGPIRSRNRTPTKHLSSPLLDHFISRHMRRERIRPSTAPPHTDCTSRGGMGIKVS
jgi:hypothetical protein